GHYLEDARHVALASGVEVRTVLVEKRGNQIIISAAVDLHRQQLAELVERGQVSRARRCVIKSLGEKVLGAGDRGAIPAASRPVTDRWFLAAGHCGILIGA